MPFKKLIFFIKLNGKPYDYFKMANYKNFEDLEIWQLSRKLHNKLFSLLSTSTDHKNGFLINHVYKTSGSIMDNIAEGFERGGNKELIQFLFISKGSAGELRSQIYRVFDQGLINEEQLSVIRKELVTISCQLTSFISYLKQSEFKGHKFKNR